VSEPKTVICKEFNSVSFGVIGYGLKITILNPDLKFILIFFGCLETVL
jgi:hypothetical protein